MFTKNIFWFFLTLTFFVSGCRAPFSEKFSINEKVAGGYIIDQNLLHDLPIGSSRQKVLLTLGTPSNIIKTSDVEIFYYISQLRKRFVSFMNYSLVNQEIFAFYFNQAGRLEKIQKYDQRNRKFIHFSKKETKVEGKQKSLTNRIFKKLHFFKNTPNVDNLEILQKK